MRRPRTVHSICRTTSEAGPLSAAASSLAMTGDTHIIGLHAEETHSVNPALTGEAHIAAIEARHGMRPRIICHDSMAEEDGDRLSDVIGTLRRHRIDAEIEMLDQSTGSAIQDPCQRHGTTLLAADGYGHSRHRDYIFGGLTDWLLNNANLPVLYSHQYRASEWSREVARLTIESGWAFKQCISNRPS